MHCGGILSVILLIAYLEQVPSTIRYYNYRGVMIEFNNRTNLCVSKLCRLAEEQLLVSGGIRMILVILEPLDKWYGTLWCQLVSWCV